MLKRTWIVGLLAAFVMTATVASPALAEGGQEPSGPDREWPREFTADDGTSIVVYAPQLEKWDDFTTLEALAAVIIRPAGAAGGNRDQGEEDPLSDAGKDDGGEEEDIRPEDILGAVRITAQTDVDQDKRLVRLHSIQISESAFPTLDEEAAKGMERTVALVFPVGPAEVPLDEVLAHLDMGQVAVRKVPVLNDPPQIIMSRRPATLVVMDGEPIFEDIEGSMLKVVLNTTSQLFKFGKYRQYYLMYGRSWLTATDLNGPWIAANNLPDAFKDLPDEPRWQAVKNSLPGEMLSIDQVPRVYVSQPPVELLVTDGEPRYMPIPGTKLLYVLNTQDDLFLSHTDGQYYGLISGRWFRTPGKGYPLMYCTDSLPEDFKNIPPDHPCGRVLASVPGTPESEEALFGSLIPRTARVLKDRANVDVTYVGDPRFTPVEGTDISYAVNTSFDVLEVEGAYYACHEAVWFCSDSPQGPWTVCDDVPSAIYEIPPEAPVHHLAYVQIFETTDEYVVSGFLPGYLGTYYVGGVVVRGTGHRYDHDPDYYRHLQRNWRQRQLARYSFHHTYGHNFYFDHLNGFFRRSPESVRHHVASAPVMSPFDSWGGAVTQTPYNAQRVASPAMGGSRFRGPDLYVGRDSGIYRRDSGGWRQYGQSGGWSNIVGPSRTYHYNTFQDREFTRAENVGTSPGTWTRPTPVQRGLHDSARSRHLNSLSSDRFAYYRNTRGNRTW